MLQRSSKSRVSTRWQFERLSSAMELHSLKKKKCWVAFNSKRSTQCCTYVDRISMTEESTAWQLLRRMQTNDLEHERSRTQRAAGLQNMGLRLNQVDMIDMNFELYLILP